MPLQVPLCAVSIAALSTLVLLLSVHLHEMLSIKNTTRDQDFLALKQHTNSILLHAYMSKLSKCYLLNQGEL